ncbi:MAG: hypothetical protein AB2827_12695 [Candidatus Thiodiazotropha sp.]
MNSFVAERFLIMVRGWVCESIGNKRRFPGDEAATNLIRPMSRNIIAK